MFIRLLKLLILSLLFVSQAQAAILFKTGWEYGPVTYPDPESELAVEDTGNPYGNMSLSSGGSYGNMDEKISTSSCFAGNYCWQIDWLALGSGEVFLQTPAVMSGQREYYVGFAMRKDNGSITGGKGVQWLNRTSGAELGRKLLYRVGGYNDSLLFEGEKSDQYCSIADSTHALLYLKSRNGTCDNNTYNSPCSEKIYIGGPKCMQQNAGCNAYPGCSEPTQANATMPSDGKWHTVIIYMKEHATDGVMSMWLDGKKIFHLDKNSWDAAHTTGQTYGPCPTSIWNDTTTACAWNMPPTGCPSALGYDGVTLMFNTYQIDFTAFKFPTYFNEGPIQDQTEWYDNFIIATTYEEVTGYLAEGIPSSVQGLTIQGGSLR